MIDAAASQVVVVTLRTYVSSGATDHRHAWIAATGDVNLISRDDDVRTGQRPGTAAAQLTARTVARQPHSMGRSIPGGVSVVWSLDCTQGRREPI